MAAARWRIRRFGIIETALLDDEMVRQLPKLDSSDPGIHLARAFRALTDESHSLALLSRYDTRQHRIHDRAYQTLRELQQFRPTEPQTPTEMRQSWSGPAAQPTEPRASASGPRPQANPAALPNEPTSAASKAFNQPPTTKNPARPAQPPSVQHPSSDTLGESSSHPTK